MKEAFDYRVTTKRSFQGLSIALKGRITPDIQVTIKQRFEKNCSLKC